MSGKFYITTPIYYVNSKPHIGHAYTTVLCDTFTRFHRLLGERVFFLTGTDEHGSKVDKAARDAGTDPKSFVDGIVPEFKRLWEVLGIEYSHFIRTTDASHKEVVQNILRDLLKRGEIYLGKYKGWYCLPCESFWTELQLKEGKCPDCQREVRELEEENYFFNLTKYQSWLIQYIKDHPGFIRPESRQNEILGFLDQPLEDLCITRPKTRLSWGIPFPDSEGTDQHVVYVWFDALINYVSAIDYSKDPIKFAEWWPADIHMIGKDILRQHAVYWPIMLKAMGVEPPAMVLGHGWWTIGGTKVSKSRGNVVDPFEMVKKFTSDGVRYYLLREVTLGVDGVYSEDLMTERFNTDLANDLGNLVMRCTSMLERYFEGKMPDVKIEQGTAAQELYLAVCNKMQDCDPRTALAEIWGLVKKANQYVDEKKPWVLSKENKTEELGKVLGSLMETIRTIAIMLQPFLPVASKKILNCFGIQEETLLEKAKDWGTLKSGMRISKCEVLFPKLDVEHD